MRVVCFGDSITSGQYLDPALAWPSLLTGHEVLKRGVPNETTRLALERFPRDVQEAGADMVVVQFGHNDCNRWPRDRGLPRVSLEAFAANLREMISRCRTFGIVPLLVSMTPSLKEPPYEALAGVYSETLCGVALAEHVACCNIRDVFHRRAAIAPLLLADWLHLSEAWHRLYASAVQRLLGVAT